MKALLQCLSHTPLKGHLDPEPGVVSEVDALVRQLHVELETFDPELIFIFAPDHYNGFFLDVMPQMCIGISAEAVGDYGTAQGPLNVPRALAEDCARYVVSKEIDLAVSYRMQVDHGFAQPLMELTGSLQRFPVIPLFINCVAPPVISFRRARVFGEAVGEFAASTGKRVLFIGSGGLSHSPPVPQIATATADVAERLISGRNPTPEAIAARQQRTIAAATRFASGTSELQALNPQWDRQFMSDLSDKNWDALDAYENASVTAIAGTSAHEVKTWLAANAAMNAATKTRYSVATRYYRAIPEWISGFGALTGVSGQGQRPVSPKSQ